MVIIAPQLPHDWRYAFVAALDDRILAGLVLDEVLEPGLEGRDQCVGVSRVTRLELRATRVGRAARLDVDQTCLVQRAEQRAQRRFVRMVGVSRAAENAVCNAHDLPVDLQRDRSSEAIARIPQALAAMHEPVAVAPRRAVSRGTSTDTPFFERMQQTGNVAEHVSVVRASSNLDHEGIGHRVCARTGRPHAETSRLGIRPAQCVEHDLALRVRLVFVIEGEPEVQRFPTVVRLAGA